MTTTTYQQQGMHVDNDEMKAIAWIIGLAAACIAAFLWAIEKPAMLIVRFDIGFVSLIVVALAVLYVLLSVGAAAVRPKPQKRPRPRRHDAPSGQRRVAERPRPEPRRTAEPWTPPVSPNAAPPLADTRVDGELAPAHWAEEAAQAARHAAT